MSEEDDERRNTVVYWNDMSRPVIVGWNCGVCGKVFSDRVSADSCCSTIKNKRTRGAR